MRLLVEPGDYVLRNAGDMAMLHVAISRLAALWPNASIQVFTSEPDLLVEFCPTAIPAFAPLPGSYERPSLRPVPLIMKRLLFKSEAVRRRLTPLFKYIRRLQARDARSRQRLPRAVLEAISCADAMVFAGMGAINDAFPEYALGLLERIELALGYRKPVVMVGQGIGPLEHPVLRSKAMAVLPRVPFIALREGRSGIPLLLSLGVDPDRVMVTGDDAIEIAISSGSARAASGFGVNLRAASYADVDSEFVFQCREILQRAARTFGAPMVPVPISAFPGEEDAITIQRLMAGNSGTSTGAMNVDTPLKIIDQIKSCRIVFTGAYHAAVFGLSLGVPVVCLAKSDYYRDKFLGVADMFGLGCEVILAREPGWQPELANALERAWRTADEVKPHLLAAAERQLILSRAGYQKVYDIVSSQEI
jgi:polysaccharide pyruvyl transferase WcaK-like protein